MDEQKDKRTGGIRRYFIASHRTSSVYVIPFNRLSRTTHRVRIVDLSVVGVGIESKERIEPGLACFEEQVGGYKFGVITWSRPSEEGYRAGISFMTLPQEKEQYILDQVRSDRSHTSLRDPEKIIETLLQSIKRESNS